LKIGCCKVNLIRRFFFFIIFDENERRERPHAWLRAGEPRARRRVEKDVERSGKGGPGSFGSILDAIRAINSIILGHSQKM